MHTQRSSLFFFVLSVFLGSGGGLSKAVSCSNQYSLGGSNAVPDPSLALKPNLGSWLEAFQAPMNGAFCQFIFQVSPNTGQSHVESTSATLFLYNKSVPQVAIVSGVDAVPYATATSDVDTSAQTLTFTFCGSTAPLNSGDPIVFVLTNTGTTNSLILSYSNAGYGILYNPKDVATQGVQTIHSSMAIKFSVDTEAAPACKGESPPPSLQTGVSTSTDTIVLTNTTPTPTVWMTPTSTTAASSPQSPSSSLRLIATPPESTKSHHKSTNTKTFTESSAKSHHKSTKTKNPDSTTKSHHKSTNTKILTDSTTTKSHHHRSTKIRTDSSIEFHDSSATKILTDSTTKSHHHHKSSNTVILESTTKSHHHHKSSTMTLDSTTKTHHRSTKSHDHTTSSKKHKSFVLSIFENPTTRSHLSHSKQTDLPSICGQCVQVHHHHHHHHHHHYHDSLTPSSTKEHVSHHATTTRHHISSTITHTSSILQSPDHTEITVFSESSTTPSTIFESPDHSEVTDTTESSTMPTVSNTTPGESSSILVPLRRRFILV